MHDISTTYLGLKLKNPIIMSSSPLTANLDNLKKCEDSGVGAVVLKSIFEEQITTDSRYLVDENEEYLNHSDAEAFVLSHLREKAIDEYLTLIGEAKSSLSIPVIASLNCMTDDGWQEFPSRFASAGADAIEINHYMVAADGNVDGERIEKDFLALVKSARRSADIPLAVKMSSSYSALSHLIHAFGSLGVNGVVLFNRFFQNDIDIDSMTLVPAKVESGRNDYLMPLRWTALMSAEIDMDICTSGGIWDGETIIKALLSGAAACGVCSAVMKKGYGVVGDMIRTLEEWMDRHAFGSIGDFRGRMAQEHMEHPELWERSQYMKTLHRKGV